jgi:hypothetical protein
MFGFIKYWWKEYKKNKKLIPLLKKKEAILIQLSNGELDLDEERDVKREWALLENDIRRLESDAYDKQCRQVEQMNKDRRTKRTEKMLYGR